MDYLLIGLFAIGVMICSMLRSINLNLAKLIILTEKSATK